MARWDVTRAEEASLSFGQMVTLVNVRRIEIVCLLGLFTRAIELGTGFGSPSVLIDIALMTIFLGLSLFMRGGGQPRLARGLVAVVLILALLSTQWTVAALGGQGRLTSAYPLMLLSLALLFVLPPRIVAPVLAALFVSYCGIVLSTPTSAREQTVAIVNSAIVSVIALVAAALIHTGRRRDYDQRREIQLRNEQLVDRTDELDTLIAITAHDLRSPLYGLRNLFDLALRRAAQDPALPLAVLGQAIVSVDAMLALATRLVDAHEAEHRPLPRLVEEDVRVHILAAVGRIAPLAQSSEVAIAADLPDRPLIARLDASALAQILDNLLSNGVRFSPAQGVLTIGAAREEAFIAIRIEDQGPGIAPDRQDRLFKKFNTGSDERPEGMPGSGMGLFIVATLADRIGASVRHEPAKGDGSAFVVSLLQRDDAPAKTFGNGRP